MIDDKGIDREMSPPAPERAGQAVSSLLARFERARAALVRADPFYASESFWKAFLEYGFDAVQVAKVEGMLKSYQRIRAKGDSPASNPDDLIGLLLDEYDSGTIETVQDLADEAEVLGTETGNEELLNAVRAFRKFQQEDWELAGRGGWDEAEAALIAGMKQARSA